MKAPLILARRMALMAMAFGLGWVGCGDDDPVCFGVGTTYAIGETYADGCRECTCNDDTSITCVATDACQTGCTDDDGVPRDRGTFWPSGDGCNVCECTSSDEVQCTANACGAPCVYAGQQQTPGSTFPSLDGCYTCQCDDDGGFTCTKLACACDATTEWWREYAGMSPSECAVIDFDCPTNTTMFGNDCGCGCEQSQACAETYDCEPPAMCDIATITAECPYSTILE